MKKSVRISCYSYLMRTNKIFVFGIIFFTLLVPSSALALQFSEIAQVGSNALVESQVRAAFADVPVMITIAQCESGFRQFGPSGTVLRGGNGTVVGIFQLSEGHTAKALTLGYDIQTIEGNIAYARSLYERQGTTPWMAAFPCWNAATNFATPNTSNISDASRRSAEALAKVDTSSNSSLLVSDLSFGMDNTEVKVLQQLLNKIGFQVSASGLGSPGQETTSFGNLTRATVRKFQCAKAIVCSGDEHTTGYGLVNAATRQALLALAPVDAAAPVIVPVTTPSSTVSVLSRELEYGMEGVDVTYLQTFLAAQGLFTAGINGTFGPVTRAAVVSFQKKYGLSPALGYVGPKTLAKIKQMAQ